MKSLSAGLLRLLFHFRAIGVENVPRQGPLLVAANHVSFLDPVVVAAGMRRPIYFMAKAELFRVPLFGSLIRSLHAYPLERAGADVRALRHGLALLEAGGALLIFPEGTRGVEGSLRAGRRGIGMLATVGEAPVVPAYVRGTGHALPRGAKWPRRARITVTYGPPIRFDRARGRERYQQITEDIMEAVGRLKVEVEGVRASDSPPRLLPVHGMSPARWPLPAGQYH
jgi:1-acyl-sn-glycerol-3-phosphate acyltransferase